MPNDQPPYENFNKVLLIEDNPGDARLVELLLGESDLVNCKITNKTTLADGLKALEESNYSAVLLDLTLPDSRGFETLEKLLEKFPDNNVIVLTGLSDKSLGINAVKAGAQDFLIKGAFDADLLAKSLRYSIERSSVLQRLEESQRIAHIGNWDYEPASKIFTASDEVYRILGHNLRKNVQPIEQFETLDSNFKIFRELFDEAKESAAEIKRDIRIKQANGDTRFVFIECQLSKNVQGKEVLTGIIQDITERKVAEQAMAKSQERYQDIFTKSKDAIYICTLDGKLVDFNNATASLMDYSVNELQELENFHQLFQEDAVISFLEGLSKNKTVQDVELKINCRNGEKKYCLLTANLNDSPDYEGYNAILRDITERKQAEELIKARDVATQSAKMKEQFIASISHEMRTPMNAVLGMSNLLIKTNMDKEQYDYVDSIKQSSEILLGIINDILEISTLQNGKLKFEYNNFDLHELLNNLINVMQYKTIEKDIYLELNVSEDVPQYIIGDKLRLNQILYNLVGNAVKFTDEGFVKINVSVLKKDDKNVLLKFVVEDSGIGIPEDKVQAIFDTFTRIRTKDRIYEGTGLGLSIAKNLVEQQGGKIAATSILGTGSTFFFDMKFEIGKAEIIEKNTAAEVDAIKINNNRSFRLLLVEDHKMNQLVARKTLERQYEDKIDITIADNGQIAVDLLKENTFDIIMMDIQMPVMDGYEATQYIRANMPAHNNTPILAMTAHAHISKDEKYKELGMDDFVLKPFEPSQLFTKIAKYINRRDGNNE